MLSRTRMHAYQLMCACTKVRTAQLSTVCGKFHHLRVSPVVSPTSSLQVRSLTISSAKFGKMEASKFKDHLIVPDVLDAAPPTVCDLVFPSGAKAILGNEIAAKDLKEQPSKVEYPVEKGAFYTVVLADVDTQNPEKNEGVVQWQQWVVMNIPEKDIAKGQVLSEYIGAGPLPGTGLHRYAIFVFKQPKELQPKEPYYSEQEGDRKFSVRDFIKKYNLGQPIAGNFFQSKYDESVKQLYKEADK